MLRLRSNNGTSGRCLLKEVCVSVSIRWAFLALTLLWAYPAAQTSAARLLVVLKDGAALAIVDPSTATEIGRVGLGENLHEVVVSADRTTAFVSGGMMKPDPTTADGTRRMIFVVDLAGRKLARQVDPGAWSDTHGLQLVGGKVYFTAEGYKTVGRYDPTANRIEWMLGIGGNRVHMLAVTSDAKKLFAADTFSDTVAAVEGTEPPNWSYSRIQVGKQPEGLTIAPDGRELWVPHRADPGLSVIDVATNKVTRTLNLGTTFAIRVKFTPDGSRALITDAAAGHLVVVDTTSGSVVKRISIAPAAACAKTKPGPTCASGLLIVPDGSLAYVSAEYDNNVAIVDLKTLEVTRRIPFPAGSHPDGLAWVEVK
jgi:YVTN family beta-propeller protein